jgi:hypothetical protein
MKIIRGLSWITLFQISFSFTAQSQQIKLADIIKVECIDSACFDPMIIKKGFLYSKTVYDSARKVKLYQYMDTKKYNCSSDQKIKFPDFLQFYSLKRELIDIIFASVKWENYTSLANEMKEFGFVFKGFKEMEGGVEWVTYTSPTFPRVLMLTEFHDQKPATEYCISYQVRVIKFL